ncbi:MAG: hypothetical protein HYV76_02385 [Candidatus Vogelbacteria bacterium]|nr:hypothetical protein [Candidatus Vogelbacteria bacterium]
MAKDLALVLDVGTTSIKALVFDPERQVVAKSYRTISKHISLGGGIVEQDPKEILNTAQTVLRETVRDTGLSIDNYLGLGLTNQRETTVVWDGHTGKPVYPAIVWEDRRTKSRCETLAKTHGQLVREHTGLPIDSYFSASKINWILNHIRTDNTNWLAGTVDTWLMWNLLDSQPHLTDFTNASRTLLFNIKTKTWDEILLELWQVPARLLPKVQHSLSLFGHLRPEVLGSTLPVVAVCGDQQASMYAAKQAGASTKVTYGTGTFVMAELGEEFKLQDGFFTTLTPTKTGFIYAHEAKIGAYAQRIDELLIRGKSLDQVVREMTQATGQKLEQLSPTPNKIILDGGITQALTLLSAQQAANPNIQFVLQQPFDGTALGIAEMIFNQK